MAATWGVCIGDMHVCHSSNILVLVVSAAALKKHEANPTDAEAVLAATTVRREGFSCGFLVLLALVLMPIFSALLFWGFCHLRLVGGGWSFHRV